ncbi:hypothetical protein A5849_001257, partial [Enterococcus sp. 10F3_DIV0382]
LYFCIFEKFYFDFLNRKTFGLNCEIIIKKSLKRSPKTTPP